MLKHKYIWFLSIITILIFFIGHHYNKANLEWSIYPILLWSIFSIYGSFNIRFGYFIRVYYQKKTSEKKIALTFNGGPHPITSDILDLLKKYDAKATFFCVGKEIEKYPLIVKRIYEEGHTIGNHTYSCRKRISLFSVEKVIQEIRITDTIIENIIGKRPVFFRPPYGITNPYFAEAIKFSNKKTIGWSIRSFDGFYLNNYSVFSRVQSRIKPGKTVLFHDTSERTVRVLEQLLNYMSFKNYTSVTVDELLDLEPYYTQIKQQTKKKKNN